MSVRTWSVWSPELSASAKMHQKIVVIDERVTLLGSLNVLSHTGERGGTHDIMVVYEGRRCGAGARARGGVVEPAADQLV